MAGPTYSDYIAFVDRKMYQQLLAYKKKYNHLEVPQSDPNLGNWVQRLRQSYRKMNLVKISCSV